MAVSASLSHGAAIHSGLINYWALDGNGDETANTFAEATSTTVDNGSVEGADGTVSFATGLFGQAADFERGSGTDGRIQVTDAGTDIDRTGLSLSISLWVKFENDQTGWQAMVAHGEGSDYRIARDSGSGNIPGPAYAGGTGDIRDLSGNNLYNQNWYHIAATTLAAGGTELFVNGVSVATSGGPANIADHGTNNLWIGNNPQGGANRMWDGLIDDVAMWDRVLTADEVALVHNAGRAGIALSAVPEPSTGLLGALAGLLLVVRRRR